MEKKQIGEKLSNLSALIQKQQPQQQPGISYDDQDSMKQYKMIFPNMNEQQGNQGQPPSENYDKLQQVQQIIQEQKQFQKLGTIQEQNSQPVSRTPSVKQQQSPQLWTEPSANETPNTKKTQSQSIQPLQIQSSPKPIQLFVQNSPLNDQNYRSLKEQNIDLLRQIAQLSPLVQVVHELKVGLQQSNERIRDQQRQNEQLTKDNVQIKQQLILSEQEKINSKRQFDDVLANNQLSQQRDLQSIRFQAQENINTLESNWRQQYLILKTENEAVINSLNAKLVLAEKENRNQQDIINSIVNQNKELSQNLELRINDLNLYHQALEEKKLEFDKLQSNYNSSLEKYENNTKLMINQYSNQIKQQEKIINELKQNNTLLSHQIMELDQVHQQTIQSQQIQVQNHINGKLEEVQKVSIVEKKQLQQFYEEKLNKICMDKESAISQKQQSIIFLEQKIAVLVQENKTLVDQLQKIKKKADTLEQAMLNQEAAYQNLTKDSQYKTLSLTKQIQELNSMIGNSNQNYNPRKSDTLDSTERIQQLEQQLSYKKEEMDLLLHHLDQVFEINRDFENKIKTLQAQLELMEEKNGRELEQNANTIKQLKKQIEDLQQQIDLGLRIEQEKDSQIRELQDKLSEEEKQRKKANNTQLQNELTQAQEQIKQLKIKHVELINKNENLEQNQREMKERYDQAIREQSEQQQVIMKLNQRFEEQKFIIEQQISALQKKNQELPQSQFKKDQRVSDLERQIEDKENQIRSLEQKYREQERKIKDLEIKSRAAEDSVNNNSKMNQYYENKIKELELRIGTYDDQIKINNKQLSLGQAKIKNLEQALAVAEDDVQRLSDINQNLENHISKSKQSSRPNNDAELLQLKESNKKLQDQITQLRNEKLFQTQSSDTEKQRLFENNRNLQDQIDKLKKEKQQLIANNDNKLSNQDQDTIKKLIQEKEKLVQNYENEIQNQQESNKQLQDQIAKLKKEKAQMTMKLMNSGMANLLNSQVSQFSERNL